MTNPVPILIYGRDSSLLETRRMLFETLGGAVYAAHDRAGTERTIRDGEPGLLVLCYTLSAEEREEIVVSARTLDPQIGILVLQADGSADPRAGEDVFNIFRGPVALKAKLEQMLQSPRRLSRPQPDRPCVSRTT
jgi:hypothetical protein